MANIYVYDASSVGVWTAGTTYSTGDFVYPSDSTVVNMMEATTGGVAHAATEPTWPAAEGTVVDNGVTWTARAPDSVGEACESLLRAVNAWTAGDVILMEYRHRENLTSTRDYYLAGSSDANFALLRSVDTADSDAYRRPTDHQIYMDAAANTQDIRWKGVWVVEGCWLETIDDMSFSNPTSMKFYDCDLKHPSSGNGKDAFSASTYGRSELINCRLNFPGYANNNRVSRRWHGCTFENSGATPAINSSGMFSFIGSIDLTGCDLSAVGNSNGIVQTNAATSGYGTMRFVQCSMPTSFIMLDSTLSSSARVEGHGCSVAGIHEDFVYVMGGDCLQDSGVYADAGFDEKIDGRFSVAMSPNSTCNHWTDIRSLRFGSVYLGGTGSKTFTVSCVHDFTALNQSDVGLFLYYLGTAGTPAWDLELGLEIGGPTTALAAHTTAWTGASGKTKVNLTATATVNQTGFYAAEVVLRKYESGKKFWFDPVLTVS